MSDKSKIEWTDSTWNPVLGCTKVSPGCDNCYAIVNATIRAGNPNEKVATAYRGLVRYGEWTGRVNQLPDRLDQPIRWRKPRKIFVNSQSDLFHNNIADEFIARVFAVMAVTPQHIYQLLTKRHARMRSLLSSPAFRDQVAVATADFTKDPDGAHSYVKTVWPLPNLWVGVSVENQQWADRRIPALLDTPAAVRWLSCEPLLGPVDLVRSLSRWSPGDDQPWKGETLPARSVLHWVVAGGESGNNARPMHPDWARSLRDQCVKGEIPFLFKQWGEHISVPVFDAPEFSGGRAIRNPRGGTSAVVIRERGPSGGFRSGVTRPMVPGDRTQGGLVMLDEDTVACRVGKGKAGRELDGRLWDEYPTAQTGATVDVTA